MSKDKQAGSNWSSAEWLKVAAMAYGLIEQGQKHRDAVIASQMAVLPRSRWREPAKLAHATAPSMTTWPKYLQMAAALSPAEREAVLLAEAPPPVGTPPDEPPPAAPVPMVELVVKKKPKKTYKPRAKAYGLGDKRSNTEDGHLVRWTTGEWARIARAAKWVSEQSPGLALPKQVNEAQVWTLEPDRLRPYSSIVQSYHTRKNGQRVLVQKLAAGLERGWTINHIPFNPPGSEPAKVEAEKTQEPEVLAPPPVEVGQSPEADILTTAAPAAGGALPSSSLTDAAKVFGITMMQALDTLLVSHSQHLLGEVNQRISSMATDMGAQVAAMIEGAMRKTVHSMVEQELGGPISPPAAPANEPAPAPRITGTLTIQGEEPRHRRVKIDVVGLPHNGLVQQVNDAIDLDAVDVRYIEPDQKNSYAPHRGRHVILLVDRIPHTLRHKITAAGIKPIFVPRATVHHITHAIEELQRSAMQ